MPKRIQRQRTKGWRMPEGVYVGRPSKWGNPFVVAHDSDGWWFSVPGGEVRCGSRLEAAERAVAAYRDLAELFGSDLESLRGRDLACWCPLDQPCHADVLLEMANR